MEIIRKYYFPLKLEIIPCIPGLVMSLLSGIDEQNEALLNDVLRTFEDAEKCVGKKYVIGAVWMVFKLKFNYYITFLRQSSEAQKIEQLASNIS